MLIAQHLASIALATIEISHGKTRIFHQVAPDILIDSSVEALGISVHSRVTPIDQPLIWFLFVVT
jgi:hypothetical protein